ncbi:hypothetical protein EGT74_24340 [Chitinophaga lutea]|uniref:Uncharacterized protein n=1 Tax=Chitinophaga lutea TaxID=2488634 RepID=A0A3N4PMG9_9BACT|nr:hypothetical protein EGT74_24340 [Chitinophaga lutea]
MRRLSATSAALVNALETLFWPNKDLPFPWQKLLIYFIGNSCILFLSVRVFHQVDTPAVLILFASDQAPVGYPFAITV